MHKLETALRAVAVLSLIVTIVSLIPSTTIYASEPLHDNRYYCERLSEYHMTDEDEGSITSYCAKLLKN